MSRSNRNRSLSLTARCILMSVLALGLPSAALADWQESRGADIAASTLDVVIIRPLAAAKVVVGAALLIPAAIFSSPMGREGFQGAYEVLVAVPAEYAFDRKVGEF
jgi:hypothetical protein